MKTGKGAQPASRAAGGRSRLSAIVEGASDAIISATLDGVITSWNAGAAAMYGYAADEMIGRGISVLLPADRMKELAPVLGQIRRGGRVEHYETKQVCRDGTLIDVSISIFPLRDESGAITGAASVARNITEHIWAEAERRASDARLHQAERIAALADLAGEIAQDFNDRLSVIAGHAVSVADAVPGNGAVQASLQQIQAAAGRGIWLTSQLLAFSRKAPARPRETDLSNVLSSARDLLGACTGDDIELRLIARPDLPRVMADPGRVEQVLFNLAANARDAMPHGGTLTVSTGLAEVTAVHDTEWPPSRPGPYVGLAVSDTGCGMDAETMHRALEPFFTTKPRGRGAGLGLSIVHGIVTQAGGGVAIDSAEGAGTTVHLYLPAIAMPAQPAGVSPAATGQAQIVLVVDDEPAVLEITARILCHNGYRALVASTCEEALALMAAHGCQLLLADAAMAEDQGPALVNRAREVNPEVRVLRMLGPAAAGPAQPGLASGPEAPFIRKPFTAPALLAQVRAALVSVPAVLPGAAVPEAPGGP